MDHGRRTNAISMVAAHSLATMTSDKSDTATVITTTTSTTDDTTDEDNSNSSNNHHKTSPKSSRSFNLARLFLGSSVPADRYLGINEIEDNGHEEEDDHSAVISALQRSRTPPSSNHKQCNSNSSPSDGKEHDAQKSMSSSEKNMFPTRAALDLWKVDQRINYRDVAAANYDAVPVDSANYDDEEGDDEAPNGSGRRFRPPRRDSIGVIQEGLQALREGKLPEKEKKHHSMSFLSDLTEREERKRTFLEMDMEVPPPVHKKEPKESASSSSPLAKTIAWRKRCVVGAFIFLAATLITWTLAKLVLIPWANHVVDNFANPVTSSSANTTGAMMTEPLEEPTISMTASAIRRRTLVLEHVIEKDLLPTHPSNPDVLLTSPTARKAMDWMTGYDVVSMKLLDAYKYYHHHDDDTDKVIQLNKQYTTNQDEINQKNKILDRYVRAAMYFKEHASADVKVTILD